MEVPCVVDVDYVGDSAKFEHLFTQRKDQGQPNTQQLDFELKLRNYKNVATDRSGKRTIHNKAFLFPSMQDFTPRA